VCAAKKGIGERKPKKLSLDRPHKGQEKNRRVSEEGLSFGSRGKDHIQSLKIPKERSKKKAWKDSTAELIVEETKAAKKGELKKVTQNEKTPSLQFLRHHLS